VRLLTRYLLRECVGPFLFALGALTGLMVLNQIARDFSDLVGKGLSWGVIGEVFALSVPFIIAMTLPMAVLVAVLYAFSRLGADNEVTALKASGVDLVHLVRPVLAAGVGLALVNFAFNDQVLPRTNHKLRTLTVDIARKKPTFELKEQMINAVIPGQFYLRAGRIDAATDRLREVVIYDLANADRRRTIYADSGFMRFANTASGTDLHLTLFDGFVHDYDRTQAGLFRRVFFHTDYVRLRGVSNQFQRTGDDAFKSDREMPVCEMEGHALENEDALAGTTAEAQLARENDLRGLLGVGHRLPVPAARVRAVRGGITVAPYCRFLAAVARWVAPTSAGADTVRRDALRRRVGLPPAAPGAAAVGADRTRPAPPPAVHRPLRDVAGTQLRSQSEMLASRRLGTVASLARYRVEIHKKFSIPAMCVVFVLIGAPLALRFPRGGVGLVIGASAGIFGMYYVGLIGGESLADKLIISPFWAMWAPNILMTAVGTALFLRLGREHATGRGEGWRDRLAAFGDRRRARREARR
jgi:lipopolysaccharide export system permease protein